LTTCNCCDCRQVTKARCNALATKRILLSAEISLPRRLCLFPDFPTRRQVKKRTAIAGDKFLQQAGGLLGSAEGSFDVVDEARERQNLPLAEQFVASS